MKTWKKQERLACDIQGKQPPPFLFLPDVLHVQKRRLFRVVSGLRHRSGWLLKSESKREAETPEVSLTSGWHMLEALRTSDPEVIELAELQLGKLESLKSMP